MASMVAIFSDRRTTFAARAQMPNRAAALALAPVTAASGPAAAALLEAAALADAALGAAVPEAARLKVDEEDMVTAMASICAFNALASTPPASPRPAKADMLSRRLFLALISPSSPC